MRSEIARIEIRDASDKRFPSNNGKVQHLARRCPPVAGEDARQQLMVDVGVSANIFPTYKLPDLQATHESYNEPLLTNSICKIQSINLQSSFKRQIGYAIN